MRFTQSISLSNIQTPSFCRGGPALRLWKPADPAFTGTACFEIAVRFLNRAAISEQLQCDLVELTGIEPVTPCLQSRCSPS